MFDSFRHGRLAETLKLAGFVAFCVGVFLGGLIAIPILAEHFLGKRRQPVFVVDLLLFGGVCAVLAAVLMAEKLSRARWSTEFHPSTAAQQVNREHTDQWAEQVRSDARLARASSYLPEIATTQGEPRRFIVH
jgi:hypothetical protein